MSNLENVSTDKKARLGRGLSSLLGDIDVVKTPTTPPPQAPVATPAANPNIAKVDHLFANPHQPRKEFQKEKLQELANSIRTHGIIQPIVVMPAAEGRFQIVAGERRWRAAQMAGLKEVPIVTKEQNEQKSLELAIIENIQRHDLNPVEEARAYQNLMKKFNLTQNEVAEKVGKDRATVANILRILSLEAEILDLISSGQITLGHAKVLLSVENKVSQRKLARKVLNESLSVRALEKITNHKNPPLKVEPQLDQKEVRHISAVQEEMQKYFGTKVSIDYTAGKGSINISFYSDDQLNDIIDKMRNK